MSKAVNHMQVKFGKTGLMVSPLSFGSWESEEPAGMRTPMMCVWMRSTLQWMQG